MRLAGVSGAKWQCDLVALRATRDTESSKRVKIECKCWIRGVEQLDLAGMAWSLDDTGADGLIIVNRALQDGAQKVAKAAEIGVLEFTPGDTASNYRAKLSNWFENTVYALGMSVTVSTNCTMTAVIRRADGTEEIVQ
jgi:hypothetical protein